MSYTVGIYSPPAPRLPLLAVVIDVTGHLVLAHPVRSREEGITFLAEWGEVDEIDRVPANDGNAPAEPT